MRKHYKGSQWALFALFALVLLNAAAAATYDMQCAASMVSDDEIRATRIPSSCSFDVGEGVALEQASLGEELAITETQGKYVITLDSSVEGALSLRFSDGDQREYAYYPPESRGGVIEGAAETIGSIKGQYNYLILGAIFIFITFALIWLFKQFIANAITGLIALVVVKFLLGISIPINGLTILVTILGGIGGVGALIIAAVFGWI